MSTAPRARWTVLAIAAAAIAYAAPVPDLGWNQGAHFALVESLDRGTTRIDDFRWQTHDVAWFRGHFYSNKAPGLALVSVPAYAVLQAAGVTKAISHRTATKWRAARVTIWALHLWAVVLPAVLVLVLVRGITERVEPGLGTITALTLGLGTLLLPFAIVYFAHVLSACLGFTAFALLWREREAGPRLAALFLAGLLAGLAVTVEYSLAIVALALGAYAIVRRRSVGKRTLAYLSGIMLGVVPLLLYNRLAFGSALHLSYVNAVSRPGRSGHAELNANATGFFGVGLPSPRAAAALLFESRGLLTLSPVLAMSAVGLALLYRRGWRAEAATIALVTVAFLVFNAGYHPLFAGAVPGPRLLVPALPFVVVPLAPAYRRYPGCTVALAAASVVTLVIATVTHPLLATDDTSTWVSRAIHGSFQDTVASFGGVAGWASPIPFVVAVVAAIFLTVLATPPLEIRSDDYRTALLLLLVWAVTASVVPRVGHAPGIGAIALIAAGAGAGAIAVTTMFATTGRARVAPSAGG